MNKNCQNCKLDFEVTNDDLQFYSKIKVPAPTFCWECRLQRRLASRRSRTMFHDECARCKKKIISMYSPKSGFTVYCHECFYSDAWDPRDYGRDYDFSKPFFQQYRDLMQVTPREPTRMRNSPGSRYCDGTIDCKNCYMCFGGFKSEDCMYGGPVLSKFTVDSDIVLNGDHVYESYSGVNAYNCKYIYFSDDTVDSSFLFDCKGCTSCFGCVNLRNQSYRIFNKQYSKAEYKEQMKYWDLGSYTRLQEAKQKFAEFKLSIPHRFAITSNVVDVLGNDIHNSKNCHYCFTTENGVENCKFGLIVGLQVKDCYDVTSCGDTSQLLYESIGIVASERLLFCNGANNSHDVEYSEQAIASSDLFGCLFLKHRQYCILNKQYSKEDYFALLSKIKEHMNAMPYIDEKGREYRYGEYFPVELSPNAYNESWASEEFLLTKDEALEAGYRWNDREKSEYQIDYKPEDLPDHIRDVPDDFSGKVIECLHRGECNEQCTTAFRVLPEELGFYKKMNLALPRMCHACRFFTRKKIRNPLKLWHRNCMKCNKDLESSYASNRPEIIYCQECYNQEFL